MRKTALLFFITLWTTAASAAVTQIPIKPELVLQPGQSELVTVPSNNKMEIGWTAVTPSKCPTPCIEAADKSSEGGMSFTLDTGGIMKYTPADGKITVEYKNKVDYPVTIKVYKVERTCEAEACAFVKPDVEGHWLVFKVDEFKSIETSKDHSYSTITGVTTGGKPFTVKAIWWTEDANSPFYCYKFIQEWVDQKAPKEKYAPYILSGKGFNNGEILANVDTCVPKAPHFGVPEENVYK